MFMRIFIASALANGLMLSAANAAMTSTARVTTTTSASRSTGQDCTRSSTLLPEDLRRACNAATGKLSVHHPGEEEH